MKLKSTYEGWVVAHRPTGEEVIRVEDRDGQCKGGGLRITFDALNIEDAKTHSIVCPKCRTIQPLAGVSGPINRHFL